MSLFGKETKNSEPDYTYYWSVRKLAEQLEVSRRTLWNFLKRKKAMKLIKRQYSKNKIPQEVADRILGLKSDPPEDIDPLEFDYRPAWIAKKMDISSKTVKERLNKKIWNNTHDGVKVDAESRVLFANYFGHT